MDFVGLDHRTTVGGLGLSLAVLADHLPILRDLPIRRSWAGLLPQTPDALPILDRAPGIDGLVIASGHVFGQLIGPLSGRLVAQMLLGEPTDFDMTHFRCDREALGAVDEAGAALRRW
jgi:glycine/D-amino acid oxidase-like deaminating enzyme